jgi:hypothetical protein
MNTGFMWWVEEQGIQTSFCIAFGKNVVFEQYRCTDKMLSEIKAFLYSDTVC